MMRPMPGLSRSSLAVGCLGLLSAALGCDCGDGGELGRVVPRIEVDPPSIDFGEIPLGATRRSSLVVRNPGGAPLELADVMVGPPFDVARFDRLIPAGGTGRVDVGYTSGSDERETGELVLVSNADGLPMLRVALSGVGVEGFIGVEPREVDFTETTVGTRVSIELIVSNLGVELVEGRLVTDGFARPEHFRLGGLQRFDEPGNLAVPARGAAQLELIYEPLAAGVDEGRIRLETCGDGCGVEVRVRASAIEAVVRLDPPALDFGAVGIGGARGETVTLVNEGARPLSVLGVEVRGAGFLLDPPFAPTTIEGGRTAVMSVDFRPEQAGAFEGVLVVETDDPGLPEARVRLTGAGEGPLFQVEPAGLDFGVVTDRSEHRRSFVLSNAGSADVLVRSVELVGDASFAVASLPGLPIRLGAGESAIGTVRFTAPAVGEFEARVVIRTDDATRAEVELPLSAAHAERTCRLETTPGTVNFGLVPPGHTRRAGVRLANVGDTACTLLSGAWSPEDPAMRLETPGYPLRLEAGASRELALSFVTSDARTAKAKHVWTTDDPVRPERSLLMIGSTLAYRDLFVLPPVLDLGQVRPTCPPRAGSVTLFNAGTEFHRVTGLTVSSTSGEHALVTALAPGGEVVRPGDSMSVAVQYDPDDLGRDAAELTIEVEGLPYQLVTPLTGEGATDPTIVDSYTQDLKRKVDVLFVVDDSCSMADDQQSIARNFSAFIRTAQVRQVDFQIGVTTTDLTPRGLRGQLVGPLLDRSTRDIESEFTRQAVRGSGGSAVEMPLEAMAKSFDLARRGVGYAAQLYRPDAGRVVIIVSDEDDQSGGTPITYFNLLRTEAQFGYAVATISGGPAGCRLMNRVALPAPDLESFRMLSGGFYESICASSWAQTLSNVGSAVFGLRRRFPLSQPADPAQPIIVEINGQLAPAGSWSYDSATGAVEFDPANVPPERSVVRISYRASC